MRLSDSVQCYCCEAIATTKDHIPPKCFFPKKKHISGYSPDYRSQLITVPACSKHNNSRSSDDEYTAAIVVMNSQSQLAFSMFETKWLKALMRREAYLCRQVFFAARSVRILSRQNDILIPCETLAVSYEINRINRVFDSIARALYYVELGRKEKWLGNCLIRIPKLLNQTLERPRDARELDQISEGLIRGEGRHELGLNRKGENQDIFFYQFFKLKDRGFIVKMVFYGDFTVLAFLMHKEDVPSPIILAV